MSSEDRIKDIAKNNIEYKAGFDPEIPLDVIEKKGISREHSCRSRMPINLLSFFFI